MWGRDGGAFGQGEERRVGGAQKAEDQDEMGLGKKNLWQGGKELGSGTEPTPISCQSPSLHLHSLRTEITGY